MLIGLLVCAIGLGLIFFSAGVYILLDYHRHKKPLMEADPNTHYTLGHHVRMVTLPVLRYRLSAHRHKNPGSSVTPGTPQPPSAH